MNRSVIVTIIAVTGAVLWVIQDRKISDLQNKLQQSSRNASEMEQRVAAGRTRERPLPTRMSMPSDAHGRVSSPERRNALANNDVSRDSSSVDTHLAAELADLMHLGAAQRTRLLPMLERHIATRRKAAAELLDSKVFHYADLSHLGGNVFSAYDDHVAFHAAARQLAAVSTKEIDPLLDPAARDILREQDETQWNNTVTLLADGDYTGWKDVLGFSGVEQQAYEVFYDLSVFRLNHPLPESFSREELASRLADERRFLTESLTPLLNEEKAQRMRQTLEALDPDATSPAHR